LPNMGGGGEDRVARRARCRDDPHEEAMDGDARLLLEVRLSVVTGGALLVFSVADAGLGAAGIMPSEGSTLRVAVGLLLAALALLNALRAWRKRSRHVVGEITFAEAILVAGLAFVGGIVLLGAFG
jgi:hypothetical protein